MCTFLLNENVTFSDKDEGKHLCFATLYHNYFTGMFISQMQ